MKLFALEYWALWCGVGLMTFAAALNVRTFRVPNWLSLSSAAIGLLAAVVVSISDAAPSQGAGILSSLAAAGVGLAALLPLWRWGVLGAGNVKMQAAFGAWVGCVLAPGPAALLVALGTITGMGLIGSAAIVVWLGKREGLQAPDLLPCQPMLSVGAIATVVMAILTGWV